MKKFKGDLINLLLLNMNLNNKKDSKDWRWDGCEGCGWRKAACECGLYEREKDE